MSAIIDLLKEDLARAQYDVVRIQKRLENAIQEEQIPAPEPFEPYAAMYATAGAYQGIVFHVLDKRDNDTVVVAGLESAIDPNIQHQHWEYTSRLIPIVNYSEALSILHTCLGKESPMVEKAKVIERLRKALSYHYGVCKVADELRVVIADLEAGKI